MASPVSKPLLADTRIDRIAFVFPLMVAIAMYAVAAPEFTNAGIEKLDGATQSGLTLSFLAIVFGSSSGWVPVSGNRPWSLVVLVSC